MALNECDAARPPAVGLKLEVNPNPPDVTEIVSTFVMAYRTYESIHTALVMGVAAFSV
jgi:hypothetical protein